MDRLVKQMNSLEVTSTVSRRIAVIVFYYDAYEEVVGFAFDSPVLNFRRPMLFTRSNGTWLDNENTLIDLLHFCDILAIFVYDEASTNLMKSILVQNQFPIKCVVYNAGALYCPKPRLWDASAWSTREYYTIENTRRLLKWLVSKMEIV